MLVTTLPLIILLNNVPCPFRHLNLLTRLIIINKLHFLRRFWCSFCFSQNNSMCSAIAFVFKDYFCVVRYQSSFLFQFSNGSSKSAFSSRSEERRVGKEFRSRWLPYH